MKLSFVRALTMTAAALAAITTSGLALAQDRSGSDSSQSSALVMFRTGQSDTFILIPTQRTTPYALTGNESRSADDRWLQQSHHLTVGQATIDLPPAR